MRYTALKIIEKLRPTYYNKNADKLIEYDNFELISEITKLLACIRKDFYKLDNQSFLEKYGEYVYIKNTYVYINDDCINKNGKITDINIEDVGQLSFYGEMRNNLGSKIPKLINENNFINGNYDILILKGDLYTIFFHQNSFYAYNPNWKKYDKVISIKIK